MPSTENQKARAGVQERPEGRGNHGQTKGIRQSGHNQEVPEMRRADRSLKVGWREVQGVRRRPMTCHYI